MTVPLDPGPDVIEVRTDTAVYELATASITETALEAFDRERLRRRRERAPARLSMSTLRRGEACELSMYLQRATGDTTGPEAIAGRAFHEFAHTARFAAKMTGRPTITPAEATSMCMATLDRITEPIRFEWREKVLGWAGAWAQTVTFPVEADYWGIEELWTADLGFHVLSGRLDQVAVSGDVVEIEDEKTGQPPRWRGYIYEAFQPRHYAWLAAQKFPDADGFLITERHSQIGRPDSVYYSRVDVEDVIEPWLHALANRIGAAWASGKFTAQPGSWCARCPAPHRCSLPEDARPLSVTDPETIRERAEAMAVWEARAKRERDVLRTLVDMLGIDAIPVGDRQLGYTEKTKRVVIGKREAAAQGLTDRRDAVLADLESLKVERTSPEFGWSRLTMEEDGDA